MKRFACTLLMIVTTNVMAWDNPDINGKSDDRSRSSSSRDDYKYQSSSGNRYQYDLNKPVERDRYERDYSAQRRDELSVSPSRDLDRDLGQYGGGIER